MNAMPPSDSSIFREEKDEVPNLEKSSESEGIESGYEEKSTKNEVSKTMHIDKSELLDSWVIVDSSDFCDDVLKATNAEMDKDDAVSTTKSQNDSTTTEGIIMDASSDENDTTATLSESLEIAENKDENALVAVHSASLEVTDSQGHVQHRAQVSYTWNVLGTVAAPFTKLSSTLSKFWSLMGQAKDDSSEDVETDRISNKVTLEEENEHSHIVYSHSKTTTFDNFSEEKETTPASMPVTPDSVNDEQAAAAETSHLHPKYHKMIGFTPAMNVFSRRSGSETRPVSKKVTHKSDGRCRLLRGFSTAPIQHAVVMTYKDVMPSLSTGDILLFHGQHSIFSETVELGSWSKFSHVGMVLKPPHYIDTIKGEAQNQLLLFQSGWDTFADVEDNKIKFGVCMVPFTEEYVRQYDGKVYVRRLMDSSTGEPYAATRQDSLNQALLAIHDTVYNKPYDTDPMDFIRAELKLHYGNTKRTDMFFCSSFLAYMYYQLGLIVMTKHNGWVLYAPKDFSSEVSSLLGLSESVYLESEIMIVSEEAASKRNS